MKLNNGIGIGEWSNVTQKLYRSYLDPVADNYGLKRVELDVLLFLANYPQHNTATEIVDGCGLVKSHVSAAVNRLEDLGYLERYYYDDNRRTIHLELTEASNAPIAEGQRAQKICEQKLFAGLTQEELDYGKTVLQKIGENIKNAYEITTE